MQFSAALKRPPLVVDGDIVLSHDMDLFPLCHDTLVMLRST